MLFVYLLGCSRIDASPNFSSAKTVQRTVNDYKIHCCILKVQCRAVVGCGGASSYPRIDADCSRVGLADRELRSGEEQIACFAGGFFCVSVSKKIIIFAAH